jgi:hypothetical protein
VTSILLMLVMLTGTGGPSLNPRGVPTEGTATWYGSTNSAKQYCVGGFKNTCSPYKSKAQGGRGGELVMYAAVGVWRFKDKPYRVRVCRKDQPTTCVEVTVRDYCEACRRALDKRWTRKSRAIDLSPSAFSRLAPLGRGVVRVTLVQLPLVSESSSSPAPRGRNGYR